MMIGMVMTTPAAAIEPTGVSNCEAPEKNAIAAGTVREALVEVSEIANTKSFQQKMNTRIAVVTTPGAASGAITRMNACSGVRSEEHTSELQSRVDLVCRLLLEKKKK